MKRMMLFAWALVVAAPAFLNGQAYADGAPGGVRIVVPARDIARGETISESDLTFQTVASAGVMSGTVTSMNDLVGMQTRRVLHAGESMRSDDVRRPILVTKGAIVTMTFEAPGITLTATGRAMSEGGLGQVVTVVNPASYRQITAVVTGAGSVRAESSGTIVTSQNAAPRIASAKP